MTKKEFKSLSDGKHYIYVDSTPLILNKYDNVITLKDVSNFEIVYKVEQHYTVDGIYIFNFIPNKECSFFHYSRIALS